MADSMTSNERALTMSVMKASEHGFNDGDHLVIDGHEYSAEQVYDAIHGLTAVETTGHCIDCIELKNALAAAVKVANEARECHDRDQDMRTMKLLIALSGHRPKWRADTDRIHDVLRRAVERLSAPMPPEEPSEDLTSRQHAARNALQGCTCGSDGNLHHFGCQLRREGDDGKGAVKSRTPLRDSDAAFNLGVLPTEQPENGKEGQS